MTDSSSVVNLADVDAIEVDEGDIRFTRRRLSAAAGARRIGCSHYVVPAGARQMPVHVHGDEEEIFFVLTRWWVELAAWRRVCGGAGRCCRAPSAR